VLQYAGTMLTAGTRGGREWVSERGKKTLSPHGIKLFSSGSTKSPRRQKKKKGDEMFLECDASELLVDRWQRGGGQSGTGVAARATTKHALSDSKQTSQLPDAPSDQDRKRNEPLKPREGKWLFGERGDETKLNKRQAGGKTGVSVSF